MISSFSQQKKKQTINYLSPRAWSPTWNLCKKLFTKKIPIIVNKKTSHPRNNRKQNSMELNKTHYNNHILLKWPNGFMRHKNLWLATQRISLLFITLWKKFYLTSTNRTVGCESLMAQIRSNSKRNSSGYFVFARL